MEFMLARDLAELFEECGAPEDPAPTCDCLRPNAFLYSGDSQKERVIVMCKCKGCGRIVHWFCAERHAENCWRDWLVQGT